MQMSQSFEQACCVLGEVARGNGRVVTNAELNHVMEVSLSYLSKITRRLVVAGLITSTPGPKGGYMLARPMHDITLRMVVEAIEGEGPFFESTGVIERVFKLQGRKARRGVSLIEHALEEAELRWRRHLEQTTMQQVIDGALREGQR